MQAKIKTWFERWSPVCISLIVAAMNWRFTHLYPVQDSIKDLLNGTLTLGSITIGFLTATESILFSIDEKYVVRQLKSAGVYKKLINYFLDAIHWSFMLVILDLIGLNLDFSSIQNWHYTAFNVWFFVLSTAILSCYRVIFVFSRILVS